jgi:hypothetical protein
MAYVCGGVNVENIQAGILNVYPNPATSFIEIDLPVFNSTTQNKITVVDALGRTAETNYNFANSKIVIDVSKLSNGFYVLQVKSDENIYSAKFIVE